MYCGVNINRGKINGNNSRKERRGKCKYTLILSLHMTCVIEVNGRFWS